MEDLFKVINLDNEKRIGNLTSVASSSVKSTKVFPIYELQGKQMVFKPLSRTKPLTTPLFAYSEVFWSYVINGYFEPKTPRYYLATVSNYANEKPKYYNQGVLVESITPNGEKLTNLYDYYMSHPDPKVDIKDYVNYCLENYDYTSILLSDIFQSNKSLGQNLAYQILLSILRQDQNFHYENISFIESGMVLAPPIDFEFSTPFLFPDQLDEYQFYQSKYMASLDIKYDVDLIFQAVMEFEQQYGIEVHSRLTKNICLIVRLYPDVVYDFIKRLDKFILDIPQIIFNDPDNFIGKLNSDYWEVGDAYFKAQDMDKYNELKAKIKLQTIDKDLAFQRITADILAFASRFRWILKIYLLAFKKGIVDLEDLTIKELLNRLEITDNVTIKDINLDTNEVILTRFRPNENNN